MANQNQQQQQFRCTGDCLNCRAINDRKVQWQYCASQHAYKVLRMMQQVMETVNVIADDVVDLKDKISAIQNSEAMVFDPNAQPEPPAPIPPTAQ